MGTSTSTRRAALKSILMVSSFALAGSLLTACAKTESDTVAYLVRHAEKVTGENVGKDPALTPEGESRAKALAELLKDQNISYIHSSDYIRTRDTAAPLAKLTGLEIEIYDPSDLPALAGKIKQLGGSHVVVGHSNTTPDMSIALGGDGGTPIVEKTEYDRLYKVTLLGDGTVHTDIQRYGVRSPTAE